MTKHPDTTTCKASWINQINAGTEKESWYCREHSAPVWPNTPQSPPAGDEQPDKLLEDAYRLGTTDATLGVDDHTVLMPKMKAALHAYILAQIKELIDHAAVDMTMPAEYILGQTELATQLRQAAQARFGNQQGDN